MQAMLNQIVAGIERLREGKTFSAKDFLDIASRTTIDVNSIARMPANERAELFDWLRSIQVWPRGRRTAERSAKRSANRVGIS